MKAEVRTYGGEERTGEVYGRTLTLTTVKHWQLYVDDEFISDSSVPEHAELFQRIADKLNEE